MEYNREHEIAIVSDMFKIIIFGCFAEVAWHSQCTFISQLFRDIQMSVNSLPGEYTQLLASWSHV